jgi:serine/threonine-protein kinase
LNRFVQTSHFTKEPSVTEADDNVTTTTDPEQVDPYVGRVFNQRFRVLDLIARGGLGAVYKAEQAPLGRVCAIKILQPRYEETTPDEFNKRFFLEASIASKLTHPNNVTLYDYGHTKDDIYFMAMELLEGKTLAQTLHAEGPMDEERATHVARQICRALREAHSLGVVHRDIKPSNIFLTQKHDEPDFVKVMDFGLVKNINLQDDGLTKAGMFMGSPKYMSPEQIQGQVVDARTDIYAVGIVLFEMVTGKPPFDRKSSVQTLIAHLNEQAPTLLEAYPSCNISPHMEQVIYRCIAKSPADRFGSTDELLLALKGFRGAAATATKSNVSGSIPILGSSGLQRFPGSSTSDPHVLGGQTGSDGLTPGAVSAAIQVEKKARQRRVLLGGTVAIVAAGAAVAAFLSLSTAPSDQPASVAPPPSAAPVVEASTATPVAPASAPVPVASEAAAPMRPLRVVTVPEGAIVRLGHDKGKRLCEATPCDVPREELPDGTVILHFTKRGFVLATEKVTQGAESVEVRLIHAGGGSAPKPDTPPVQPKTYKIDPY